MIMRFIRLPGRIGKRKQLSFINTNKKGVGVLITKLLIKFFSEFLTGLGFFLFGVFLLGKGYI